MRSAPTPNNDLPRNVVLEGDVRKRLAELPASSVDCVVTSPPYFQLRNYGVKGQIGLEDDIEGWVDELRLVMRGLARVLKPTGSVWLNLGDTFSRHDKFGAPPKSFLLGPERLGLRLLEDGWTIRNKIVWRKTNARPSPVGDRLSCSWEVIYLLTRNRRYHFDLDAIRVPHTSVQTKKHSETVARTATPGRPPAWSGPLAGNNSGLARLKAKGLVGHPLGKNPGDVWSMASSNYRGQHFARGCPDSCGFSVTAPQLFRRQPDRTCPV